MFSFQLVVPDRKLTCDPTPPKGMLKRKRAQKSLSLEATQCYCIRVKTLEKLIKFMK